jgi:hypothetical protein
MSPGLLLRGKAWIVLCGNDSKADCQRGGEWDGFRSLLVLLLTWTAATMPIYRSSLRHTRSLFFVQYSMCRTARDGQGLHMGDI